MFKFHSPYYLLLIPIIVAIFFIKRRDPGLKVPSLFRIKSQGKKSKKQYIEKFFMLLSLLSIAVALARPQMLFKNSNTMKNGVDIVIALDLSRSMMQEDFKPSRLSKSKELLGEFVDKRGDDRLSLVIFGGDAYTKVPLTFDHNVLKQTLKTITIEDITSNTRTAIGMGLGVAINRLKNSKAKSKIIILLTDGENNSGEMSPMAAAKIAKEYGIKVYTIGIGAYELAIPGIFGVNIVQNKELDENLLKNIALETNGEYFRASNPKEFNEIFKKIDALEKTEIEAQEYYEKNEYFEFFIKLSLFSLLIALLFQYVLYIKIP